jgi:hypothetical protein
MDEFVPDDDRELIAAEDHQMRQPQHKNQDALRQGVPIPGP